MFFVKIVNFFLVSLLREIMKLIKSNVLESIIISGLNGKEYSILYDKSPDYFVISFKNNGVEYQFNLTQPKKGLFGYVICYFLPNGYYRQFSPMWANAPLMTESEIIKEIKRLIV
jgi:hypothetical protein